MTPASKLWLWIFWLSVIADLSAVYCQWNEVRYASKPAIVLSLLIFFSQVVKHGAWAFRLALLFSLMGDVALLFEDRDPLFFMAGLGSFLIAHIFYIVAFVGIRKLYRAGGQASQPGLQWGWIIFTVLYVGTLLYSLMPYLGELKIPVIVYACVLGSMLVAVTHAFPKLYSKPGIICLAGALFFVISDSLLALNKFYMGFPLSGIAIMLTYALAQYLLTIGAVRTYSNPNFAPHPVS
ncbi:MAG TPA: lysoplasmalogenase [Chitinophagaceae bacterium]